jgi:CheY-like chemotaxis protein
MTLGQQILSHSTVEKLTGLPKFGLGDFLGPVWACCKDSRAPELRRERIPLSNALFILCFDDEPVGLLARRLLLSITGYTVLTAESGEIALRLFNCNHVDLVLTDHLLPDLTVAQLASEMKRRKPEVPIVLLTGLVEPPSEFKYADLLLTKGTTPPEFLAAIAKLLSKPQSAGTGAA